MKLQPTPAKGNSYFGASLLEFVEGHEQHLASAHGTCAFLLTHGGRYPFEQGIGALAPFDRAVLNVLARHPELPVEPPDPWAAASADGADRLRMTISVNNLGRLHLRGAGHARPVYGEDDAWLEIGSVHLDPQQREAVQQAVAEDARAEAQAYARIRIALDAVEQAGQLAAVLGEVIDHVQHVESVCFYSNDRFFALIDRHVNLVDVKDTPGFLPQLGAKPYALWTPEEITIVGALHALFLSGRSVRFEEFNGVVLDARALVAKLADLYHRYEAAGVSAGIPFDADLFEVARAIRRQTLQAPGKSWLRYRWIYGLNFQKRETILPSQESTEAADAGLQEFAGDYAQLCGQPPAAGLPEHLLFTQLAAASLARDLANIALPFTATAAGGWVEYLMERIVGSAVISTGSDYGMSSSLRDLATLVEYDDAALEQAIHGLTPPKFFTCFVSFDFASRLDQDSAAIVAASVQKRMQFNRWHFIPGNMERQAISAARHWYYPPLIPDIAVRSDMHRAAHNRAMVKFSIRAPGPDMGRPPIAIAGRLYRGFYDVRVVRMAGETPYTPDDMLRCRRRTLWLENVYAVLAAHVQSRHAAPFAVRGFEAGRYADIPAPGLVMVA